MIRTTSLPPALEEMANCYMRRAVFNVIASFLLYKDGVITDGSYVDILDSDIAPRFFSRMGFSERDFLSAGQLADVSVILPLIDGFRDCMTFLSKHDMYADLKPFECRRDDFPDLVAEAVETLFCNEQRLPSPYAACFITTASMLLSGHDMMQLGDLFPEVSVEDNEDGFEDDGERHMLVMSAFVNSFTQSPAPFSGVVAFYYDFYVRHLLSFSSGPLTYAQFSDGVLSLAREEYVGYLKTELSDQKQMLDGLLRSLHFKKGASYLIRLFEEKGIAALDAYLKTEEKGQDRNNRHSLLFMFAKYVSCRQQYAAMRDKGHDTSSDRWLFDRICPSRRQTDEHDDEAVFKLMQRDARDRAAIHVVESVASMPLFPGVLYEKIFGDLSFLYLRNGTLAAMMASQANRTSGY